MRLPIRVLIWGAALALGLQAQYFPNGGGSGGAGGQYSGAAAVYSIGTVFLPPGGGLANSATEASVQGKVGVAGTISNFTVNLSAAVGASSTAVFTWRKNGADQVVTCTLTGTGAGGTTCSDLTHNFQIAVGDLIDVKVVVSGANTASVAVVMTWGLPGVAGPAGAAGATGATGATGPQGPAGAGAGPPYTASFTSGTGVISGSDQTITILQSTHGQGIHPALTLFDSTGHWSPPNYNCLDAGSAEVKCSDSTSTGNIVLHLSPPQAGGYEINGAAAGVLGTLSIADNGTVRSTQGTLNLINGNYIIENCVNNSGASRADCTPDVNTVALNALYAQLAVDNIFANGVRNTMGLSAAKEGLALTCGAIPSTPTGGGLGCTAGGVPWIYDGININKIPYLLGSGLTPAADPTSGRLASWGPQSGLLDAGFLATNVVRKDAANTGAAAMTLDMSASTTANALRAPVGAGLTAGADGAIVYDSTAKITHVRTNGADSDVAATTTTSTTTTQVLHATATAGLYSPSAIVTADLPTAHVTRTATITDLAPVSGDSGLILAINPATAIHLTRLFCAIQGSTNVVVNLDKRTEAAIGTDTGNHLLGADLTAVSGGANTSTFANGAGQCGGTGSCAIAAHAPVVMTFTSLSGTPTALNCSLDYTVD